jgi:hypothetical protein
MAAVAFFYAGSLHIPWQLLIIVIFLFFGTLALFVVLFDEPTDESTEPLVTTTVQAEDNENDSYQNDPSTTA